MKVEARDITMVIYTVFDTALAVTSSAHFPFSVNFICLCGGKPRTYFYLSSSGKLYYLLLLEVNIGKSLLTSLSTFLLISIRISSKKASSKTAFRNYSVYEAQISVVIIIIAILFKNVILLAN